MKKTALHYIIATLVLALAFGFYTANTFPSTYRFMEGDGFWAFTRDFWQLKLAMAPALTGWITDFLIQFYSNPWVGASISAAVLALVALLCGHLLCHLFPRWEKLSWLGLLPAFFLGFYVTFHLNMHLQVLFLLLFLLSYISLPDSRLRLAASFVLLPLAYFFMVMPLIGFLLLSFMLMESLLFGTRSWRWQVAGWAILWLLPIVYSQQVAFIPFQERYTHLGSYIDPLTSTTNRKLEEGRTYILLANEGRWSDLLYKAHARKNAQMGDALALRFALLAESELGTLPDNILDYPIREESQFYFPHIREYFPMQFNRLFYLSLGVNDEAFHHAEEYYLQQRNGICFQSLRQMVDYSIAEGEWEVAEKYLALLQRSTCHKVFVQERREQMTLARGHVRKPVKLRADNFVGGYPLPVEMLRLERYYKDSPHRKKMVDYAICSYLLRGDMTSFRIALNAFEFYKSGNLPRGYQVSPPQQAPQSALPLPAPQVAQ